MLTVDFDRLEVAEGTRVLDLGCGTGRHTFAALERGARVCAVDLDREALTEVASMSAALGGAGRIPGRAECHGLRANALALPFADGCFDVVIASEVLEHIASDTAALQEIARVVAPHGIVAATVPRFWPEAICWALSDGYHNKPGGHIRIYRASQLMKRMEKAGLHLSHSGFAHALHSPYWWIKCAFDPPGGEAGISKVYHRVLVWEIEKRPRSLRLLERSLNPVLGKSLVVYAQRGPDIAQHVA
jgi:SAM-dependent methyltransferase